VLLTRGLPRARTLELRARQLEVVIEVIRKAGGSLELQEVLDAVTRMTVELTGVRGCSVKLWDPDTGSMRVRSMAGIQRQAADLAIAAAEDIHQRSLLAGRPVLVEDGLVQDFPEVDDQTESLICVPLRGEGKVLGALCVYGQKGQGLSPHMLALLSTLGDLVTLSIRNALVFEGLQRVDEAKSWFLLRASHELRSPLSTIQSIASTLLQGFLGPVPREQREMLERIERRAKGLSEAVNDLLVLARSKATPPTADFEKVNLCGLLEETARFYQVQAEQRGITLSSDCRARVPLVFGQPEKLRSILTNLLSNAIKYTPPGGRVDLVLKEEEREVAIEVSDTGIGIPPEEQKSLFTEFFRASNARSSGQIGTGLGLVIVKTTVEQMGGTIEVQSAPGRGSTFRVLLKKAAE
jgi:signal transduction histidine kinase